MLTEPSSPGPALPVSLYSSGGPDRWRQREQLSEALAFFHESFDRGQGRPVEERAGFDGAEASFVSCNCSCDAVEPALGLQPLFFREPAGLFRRGRGRAGAW